MNMPESNFVREENTEPATSTEEWSAWRIAAGVAVLIAILAVIVLALV